MAYLSIVLASKKLSPFRVFNPGMSVERGLFILDIIVLDIYFLRWLSNKGFYVKVYLSTISDKGISILARLK